MTFGLTKGGNLRYVITYIVSIINDCVLLVTRSCNVYVRCFPAFVGAPAGRHFQRSVDTLII